jgi:hypothetical protein
MQATQQSREDSFLFKSGKKAVKGHYAKKR